MQKWQSLLFVSEFLIVLSRPKCRWIDFSDGKLQKNCTLSAKFRFAYCQILYFVPLWWLPESLMLLTQILHSHSCNLPPERFINFHELLCACTLVLSKYKVTKNLSCWLLFFSFALNHHQKKWVIILLYVLFMKCFLFLFLFFFFFLQNKETKMNI